MHRRLFLKKGTAALAGSLGFPYVIRSTALGKAAAVAPSNRIVLALIGCGAMGNGNLRRFLNMPDVQVVAVCDVDQRRAQATKQLVDNKQGHPDCVIYSDYRELIARTDLDAVTHALPDHWHAKVSVDCAQAGLDIYGEKPLSRTIREGRLICEAVKRYGCIWQTGSWQRSVAIFHRAAELVINGRIGKVRRVEVGLPNGSDGPEPQLLEVPDYFNWDMWLGPAPWRPYQRFGNRDTRVHWDWRWIMDYSGGQLTDWAGHHIDIAHWGLGLDASGPVQVQGQGVYPSKGIYNVPKAYKCVCHYANGLEMIVANARQQPMGMGTAWYGDKGWIHVTRNQPVHASDPGILREVIGPEEIRLYKSHDHRRNFIDCIKTRRTPITPAETAHRSITVGFLCEIAMLAQRKIQWDLEKEQIINDPRASRLLSRPWRSPWHI